MAKAAVLKVLNTVGRIGRRVSLVVVVRGGLRATSANMARRCPQICASGEGLASAMWTQTVQKARTTRRHNLLAVRNAQVHAQLLTTTLCGLWVLARRAVLFQKRTVGVDANASTFSLVWTQTASLNALAKRAWATLVQIVSPAQPNTALTIAKVHA